MYILIADSGSTKTDWALVKGKEIVLRLKTIGINPYFHSAEQIKSELQLNLKPALGEYVHQISHIYYYGTGCSTVANCRLIEESLQAVTGVAAINVSHDLLAAARALCKHEWGIAAILGTGSNSCLYNGQEILENVPSTGYLWSDYGGGSQIGKFFIKDYFEERLPAELKSAFEKAGYNREVILENVYKKSVPGRYLASVSLFVSEHNSHPFIQKLLEECFDSFFEMQVNRYTDSKKYKVHTVGSVGFFYRDFIAKVASKHGYQMGNVIQSPIEGLIDYHNPY